MVKPVHPQWPRVLRSLRRGVRRGVSVFLTAAAFGLGGGLGGLGSGTHKVGRPERDNPIVCVAQASSKRE